jgi:hypothetical protein
MINGGGLSLSPNVSPINTFEEKSDRERSGMTI